MKYILLFPIIFLVGCSFHDHKNKEVKHDSSVLYDIKIDYSSMLIEDKRRIAGGDSVAIGFEGAFLNDTVDVFRNNKYYKTNIVTADNKTDGAGHITIDSYRNLENVGIRINKGPLIFIEMSKQEFHINLSYRQNQVDVKFYKYLPAMY